MFQKFIIYRIDTFKFYFVLFSLGCQIINICYYYYVKFQKLCFLQDQISLSILILEIYRQYFIMARYRYCQYVKTYITINCRKKRKRKTYITYFNLKNRKLYYIRSECDTDIPSTFQYLYITMHFPHLLYSFFSRRFLQNFVEKIVLYFYKHHY